MQRYELFFDDGRWMMEDGRWEMEDGRWEMGDVNFKIANQKIVNRK